MWTRNPPRTTTTGDTMIEKIIMEGRAPVSSVHIPHRAGDCKWFEYEQQWKRSCLALLNDHVPPGRRPMTRVLDFGSGRGEFLSLLKNEGYACEGADFDVECVRLCSEIEPASW